jgi:hypothetical protein
VVFSPGRAHIERRIPRRIRNQGQSNQDSHSNAQKSNQLIEPFIFSRCKEAHEILLSSDGAAAF